MLSQSVWQQILKQGLLAHGDLWLGGPKVIVTVSRCCIVRLSALFEQ